MIINAKSVTDFPFRQLIVEEFQQKRKLNIWHIGAEYILRHSDKKITVYP